MKKKEQQKLKIRERYKGADTSRAEFIPAKEQPGFYANVKRRVAVYVRVSTDNVEQTSSYELQKNYYEDLVGKNPNWVLVDIYADEGISGTSLKHRDAFNRMIRDCEDGKIDLIITKSGARFTRNLQDYSNTRYKLDQLSNPVGIYFESEAMYSLKGENEMPLNFIITMAQEESRIKSSVMNSSIEMRFSRGILLTPVLLGYDHDEEGNLIINKDEAHTVQLIFYMYLFGYNCEQIADELSRLGRLTKKGSNKWTSSTVSSVLRNERYCGDVLARKTYTPNYKDHLSKKNRGDRNQYLWHDTHEPIISRGDFIAVQHLLNNAKYKNNQILPELKVIVAGGLKGFVSINPRWSAFSAEDYINVSKHVSDVTKDDAITYKAQKGEFDFRGYEIVRSQMFNISDKVCVTFSAEQIIFGLGALRRLDNCKCVELMIHPDLCWFAVKPCEENNKNFIVWRKMNNMGRFVPKNIHGKAFLKTIFELCGWDTLFKYRANGFKLKKSNDSLLIFKLKESEVLVPRNRIKEEISDTTKIIMPYAGKKFVSVLSSESMNNFGDGFYGRLTLLDDIRNIEEMNCSENIVTFPELKSIDITPPKEVKEKIDDIKSIINGEAQ